MNSTHLSRPALRRTLLAQRKPNPIADEALRQHLHTVLDQLSPRSIALYWPIRGEFDARATVIAWRDQLTFLCTLALPCATQKNAPLSFLTWDADGAMTTDVYGIPTPANTLEIYPDVLLIPCVGFSLEANQRYYRLGYGTGSYDRTLAQRPAISIGIAYESGRTSHLHPAPHDIALDYLITQAGWHRSSVR